MSLQNNKQQFIDKMIHENLPQPVVDTFIYYYELLCAGHKGLITDESIEAINENEIVDADKLERPKNAKKYLQQAVIIRLNGGLGTTMGLPFPKSLLEVKNGMSFLEIFYKQALRYKETLKVPLVLMNSYNTHQDTLDEIAKFEGPKPICFVQHKFPKVLQSNLAPVSYPENPEIEWNPPGHGDIFTALQTSGTLKKLLDMGILYAFISNSDNLGATLDESILAFFASNNFSFMMEVATRQPSDKKGGHLARIKGDGFTLRELTQCSDKDMEKFQDINWFRFFNTNNIWLNLKVLHDHIRSEKIIRLPMICNSKNLAVTGTPVFTIESAVGAAISLFKNSTAIKVNRKRFMPVKNCTQLLLLLSDCYICTPEFHIIPNPNRTLPLPNIDLDSKHYWRIDQLYEKFPSGLPSLMDCTSWVVKGDILFEKNVAIKGNVVIRNTQKRQARIKEGTIIDKDMSF